MWGIEVKRVDNERRCTYITYSYVVLCRVRLKIRMNIYTACHLRTHTRTDDHKIHTVDVIDTAKASNVTCWLAHNIVWVSAEMTQICRKSFTSTVQPPHIGNIPTFLFHYWMIYKLSFTLSVVYTLIFFLFSLQFHAAKTICHTQCGKIETERYGGLRRGWLSLACYKKIMLCFFCEIVFSLSVCLCVGWANLSISNVTKCPKTLAIIVMCDPNWAFTRHAI